MNRLIQLIDKVSQFISESNDQFMREWQKNRVFFLLK